MLNQIAQLAEAAGIDLAVLRHAGLDGEAPVTPAAAFASVRRACAALVAAPAPQRPWDAPRQHAMDLLRFLAGGGAGLEGALAGAAFSSGHLRAWEEPLAGPWTGLCSLVQDVWAHLYGPEADDDDHVLARAAQAPDGAVLDFGCGAGSHTLRLGAARRRVDAWDADPVKRQFLAWCIAARGLAQWIRLKPPEAGGYALILAIDVLDHVREPAALLDDLTGRLAPGGHLLMTAAFPGDGYHTCDGEAQAHVHAVLFTRLRHIPYAEGAVEVFEARSPDFEALWRAVPPAGVAALRPRLRADCVLLPHPEMAEAIVAGAPRFYTRPVALAAGTARLLAMCDGSRNVETLAALSGFTIDEVWEVCEALWLSRLLDVGMGEAFRQA